MDDVHMNRYTMETVYNADVHFQCMAKDNRNSVDSFKVFKVYFDNIREGHIPMWIYTMYAGMSTGKYNDK